MIPRSRVARSRRARRLFDGVAVGALVLAGCSSTDTATTDAGDTVDEQNVEAADDTSATTTTTSGSSQTAEEGAPPTDASSTESTGDDTGTATATSVSNVDLGAVGSLVSSVVHDITLEFDRADYDAMVQTYTDTGDKEWITATVTIDGTAYEQVGLRLKGNSSLRGVTVDDDPATIPWLVKLDEFVAAQHHDGLEEFVIRSSSSTTALNEAVALELLELAGLASQDAIAVRLTVNGGEQVLRLVIDSPDGAWMTEEFAATGALYKAESTGDWSYRGDDPGSYTDVFDQEAGKDNADLTPLIDLLQFVNESDDATFEAELGDWLDIESFATYLAMQDLLDNFDDINGPGNNAYLYYDTETELFTVVPWDYNLAFGARPSGSGGGGAGGEMPTPPGGFDPGQMGGPAAAADDEGRGGGFGGGPGGMNRSNPLVDRFLANDEWNALYERQLTELEASLYGSGTASALLDAWSAVVADSGLVDQSTIDTEAGAIETYFS